MKRPFSQTVGKHKRKTLRQLNIILTIICYLITFAICGQTNNADCDSIYDFVEIMPKYDNEAIGLMNYLSKDLSPILSDCIKRDSVITASMYLTLTIDKQGHVIDVEYKRIEATDQCKEELRKKIMTMTGWTPGQHNGQPVCCRYTWPVSCIKWN